MKRTKELARELGFIRQRAASKTAQIINRRQKSEQIYSYLIVLDYESTCWEQKKFQTQEIIEFPAVLLNTSSGEIESQFHFYVQPEERPILSDFCKQLTGITQEQVDNGIPLRLCLKKFSHWLNKIQKEKGVIFNQSTDSSSVSATFVTWSDWDLGTCLLNECKRKQILKPSQLNSWIDLRATYRKFYDRKPNGLNGALKDLGIEFEGREHSGLHDARNTATLAYRMMKDGCVMNITKTLNKGKISSPSYSSIHQQTLSSKRKQTSPLQSSPKRLKISEPSPKRQQTSLLKPSIKQQKFCGPNTDLIEGTPCKQPPAPVLRRSPRNFSKEHGIQCLSPLRRSPRLGNKAGTKRDEPPLRKNETRKRQISSVFSIDQIYIDKTESKTVMNSQNKFDFQSNCETVSINTCIHLDKRHGLSNRANDNNTENIQNHQHIYTKQKSDCSLQTTEKPSKRNSPQNLGLQFKIPSPTTGSNLTNSATGQNLSSNSKFTSFNSASNSVLSTPSSSVLKTPNTSTMKITPPLCNCGKRSKRRLVQSPGPNLGRFFFSCAGNKSDRNGCGYFKWETPIGSEKSHSRQQSFVAKYNVSGISKPFTPVYQQPMNSSTTSQQRRHLGVRPTVVKPCIRT